MANNISFTVEQADQNKGFRAGRPQSLLANGVKFTISGFKLGRYLGSSQDANSQSILLSTNFGEDINVNRFLRSKKLYFDKNGETIPVVLCEFGDLLNQHLNKLNRRSDNPSYFEGSAEDVAKHLMTFFTDKQIVCETVPDVYTRNDENKLVLPFSDVLRFKFV